MFPEVERALIGLILFLSFAISVSAYGKSITVPQKGSGVWTVAAEQ